MKRNENLEDGVDDEAGAGSLVPTGSSGGAAGEGKEEKKAKKGFKSMSSAAKSAAHKLSPKTQRKKTKATVALMKVFPNELESQSEFDGFTEWLQTFELYRGKQAEEVFEDETRVVGKFKVRE